MRASKRFDGLALAMLGLGGLVPVWAQESARPAGRPDARRYTVVRPSGETTATLSPEEPSREERRGARERPLVEFEVVCGGEIWGQVVLELFPERTSATVSNFLNYVEAGYYEGTIFHRVLPDFVIQGGGYAGLEQPKLDGLREPIRNESRMGPKNTRGTIAMARKRDPHSAVAQFFINVADNESLDYPQAGAVGYCVFGKVLEGMEVVDRIKDVPTRVSPEAQRRFERYQQQGVPVDRAEKSQPINPPTMRNVRRVDRAEYEQRAGHTPAGMPRAAQLRRAPTTGPGAEQPPPDEPEPAEP